MHTYLPHAFESTLENEIYILYRRIESPHASHITHTKKSAGKFTIMGMVNLAEIISRAHRVVALAVLGASLPLSTVNSASRTHASSHISSRIRV